MRIETKNILDLQISKFPNPRSKSPSCITIGEALSSFMDETYRVQILKLRELNSEEYDVQKRLLPAITFCGAFSNGHKKDDLVCYNDLLILDIDKLESEEELLEIKKKLCSDSHIIACWESPSKKGVKALMHLVYENSTDDVHENHKCAFSQIESYLIGKYNIILDPSGKDISRLCFVSYDNNLHMKQEVDSFIVNIPIDYSIPKVTTNKTKIETCVKSSKNSTVSISDFAPKHKNPNGKNKKHERDAIMLIIKYLSKRKLSITDDYEAWFKIGYAIANSFDCTLGENYYLKLCRLDGNRHDEDESKKMIRYCYDNSKGFITFGTIWHYAKLKGFINRKLGGEDGSLE